MADKYAQRSQDVESQARGAFAVTPDDDNDLEEPAKALFIGTGGDVTVIPINGTDPVLFSGGFGAFNLVDVIQMCCIPINGTDPVLFANHPTGYMRVQVKRVMETGTDADDIVALID